MSAYTKGDRCINARFQCQIFDWLMQDGIVLPYAPLVSHFQQTIFPRTSQDWIDYGLAIIPRFDAGLRLDVSYSRGEFHYTQAESTGADEEQAKFESLELPVFHTIGALYKWAKGDWNG